MEAMADYKQAASLQAKESKFKWLVVKAAANAV